MLKMNARIFEIEDCLIGIIPLLKLKEIPPFAVINKTTGQLIHKLNTSGKFQQSSGVYKALLESLQRDAKIILDNPLSTFNENNETFLKALKNIMSGKIDTQTITALRYQRLIYRTKVPEEAFNAAGNVAAVGFKFVSDRPVFVSRDARVDGLILIATLLLAVLILVYGGIKYGVNSCVNHCRAKRQQERLQQRLLFFKDIADKKEDKPLKEEKNSLNSGPC